MTKTLLQQAITQTVEDGKKAFVPYIMAGDGGIETLKETILFLQEAGVTAIELGIPFSDPVADGVVIQLAGERALQHGVTLKVVMQEVATFKEDVTVPLIIMTYLNPILSYGIAAFVADCEKIGISGLIVPDLPLEESALLTDELQKTGVGLIQLASLTSPKERLEKITAASDGFVYAVTVNGITGVRANFRNDLQTHLTALKELSPIPVLAGFGISTPEHVREMSEYTDGVIVGSAIVNALHTNELNQIKTLVNAAKKVMD